MEWTPLHPSGHLSIEYGSWSRWWLLPRIIRCWSRLWDFCCKGKCQTFNSYVATITHNRQYVLQTYKDFLNLKFSALQWIFDICIAFKLALPQLWRRWWWWLLFGVLSSTLPSDHDDDENDDWWWWWWWLMMMMMMILTPLWCVLTPPIRSPLNWSPTGCR